MSTKPVLTITSQHVPKITIVMLLAIFGLGLFVVGFDQGHMFSLAEGPSAFDDLYLHEVFHDMRHAAGYPCH